MQLHPQAPHPKDLLSKRLSFNDRVAVTLGNILGSMGFFYICLVMDIIELPAVILAASMIGWITYVAQTVIQLVALPIISTQQNLQQKYTNAKMDTDHRTLTYLSHLQDTQVEMLAEQTAILKLLQQRAKR